MGADFYSRAAIGLRVNPSDLWQPPAKVKAFDHNYSEEFEFDPKSGKKLWNMEKQPVPGFDPDGSRFGKYKMAYTTDQEEYVIALALAETGSSRWGKERDCSSTSLPSPEAIEAFKKEMKTAGLWKESSFGLWAILYCSY